jgi:hypothetical protein
MHAFPRLGIMASACLLSSAALLAAAPPVPKATAPNSEFSALIVGTTQYAHTDVWAYTPPNTGPQIPGAGEIVRDQRLDIIVSFGEFAVDQQGNADVVYDLTLTTPEGKTQVIGAHLTAFKGHVTAPHMVHNAAQSLGFAVTKDDPLGTYRFSAKLTDRIGRAEVEVSGDVQVVDGNADKPLPTNFDVKKMSEWLMHYYEHPEPRMALPVLRFIAHDKTLANNAGSWPPNLGAYEMILRDNPWLVARFQSRILGDEADVAERSTLLYVLAYVFRSNPAFGEFLPANMREAFTRTQNQLWPDPDREILSGAQLDLLWGRFLATGAFAPIQRLVSVLDYMKFQGSIAAYKRLEPKPKVAPPEVYKEAVYGAAVWSLKSNATQHQLVHDYLTYLANDPKTGPETAIQIALICGYKVKTSDGKVIDPNAPATGEKH